MHPYRRILFIDLLMKWIEGHNERVGGVERGSRAGWYKIKGQEGNVIFITRWLLCRYLLWDGVRER